MRAIVVDRLTQEPERLQVSEWATPTAGPGEVLIDVRAAGCNFSDVLMLSGTYQVKPELPFVLGREAAGVISALGEGARGLSLGDRVLAFTDLGAFAERAGFADYWRAESIADKCRLAEVGFDCSEDSNK